MKTNTHPLVRTCIALLASAGVAQASLIFEDQFAVPPDVVGTLPDAWTTTGSGTNTDYVAAGNLTYTGLAAGTAGSWAHDGTANQGYRKDFSGSSVAASSTVYYSFLFRLDTIGNLLTAGSASSFIGLSRADTTAPGASGSNQMVSSWGIRKDSTDGTKFNLSVDGSFRGSSSTQSQIVGLGAWAATGGTQFSVGTTYLLVASFTNAASTANFWVNPTSLGGAAPAATQTDASIATANIQSVFAYSAGTTTSVTGLTYSIDAIRVGSTFAAVTPIPEPSTLALLAISLSAVVFFRRRR